MSKPQILFFDEETSPILGYSFGLYETNIAHVVRNTHMMSFAWKRSDEKNIHSHSLIDYPLYKKDPYDDTALLKDLHALMESADILVAHNGDKFDIKMANARFIEKGLKPIEKKITIDTLKLARKRFKFTSNKLTDLAQYAKIGKKVETGGIMLWVDCLNGNKKAWKKMCEYNRHDVYLLEKIYYWLEPWSELAYNMNVYKESSYSCPKCSSHKVQKRGFSYSKLGKYQRFQCTDCGRYILGKDNLLENKPKVK
jgi:uncharacterized protein YprB with RNaseH-like and TPR domain/DNA-directed RNA polymerase subunit RPC12/RpoP